MRYIIAYILDLIKIFKEPNSPPLRLLPFWVVDVPQHISRDTTHEQDPYASAIGSFIYVMLYTRPEIAYTMSVTSRYQLNPGEVY